MAKSSFPLLLSLNYFSQTQNTHVKRKVSVFHNLISLVWLYALSVHFLRSNRITKITQDLLLKWEMWPHPLSVFSMDFSLMFHVIYCPDIWKFSLISISFLVTEHMKIYEYKLCLMDRKFVDPWLFLLHVKWFHYEENSLSSALFERCGWAFLRKVEKDI